MTPAPEITIQHRVFFAVAIFPVAVGIFTAATEHVRFWRREMLLLLVALAGAAVCIWSPSDPRIPHNEHLSILLFVFAIPLSLLPVLARVRSATMKRWRLHDSRSAIALMAWVNFLVFLVASVALASGLGLLHLNILVLRAS